MAKTKKKLTRRKFKVTKNPDPDLFDSEDVLKGWYVVGFECGPMGPYEDREEAVEVGDGVQRFYDKHAD